MLQEINKKQDAYIEDFELFEDDLESKLLYLIDLGKKIPPMPDEFRQDNFLVKGCQSKVWVCPRLNNGRLFFEADSNTEITKGLLSLLIGIWNGENPEAILNTDLYFIERIGMGRMIGSQRSNGFTSMIQVIKQYAQSSIDTLKQN